MFKSGAEAILPLQQWQEKIEMLGIKDCGYSLDTCSTTQL